jgi:tripeptide aminopeptidase
MFFSTEDEAQLETDLLERFVRYVQVPTTSDPRSATKPSTPTQLKLLEILHRELAELEPEFLQLVPTGYLVARFGASASVQREIFALIAHVDTSPDAPGDGVKPLVHAAWNGQALHLPGGALLDPKENPLMENYRGKTLITSDGTTLLGADDKAGVAEILGALVWLKKHPEVRHGAFEVVFTTDEEIGRGTEGFPFDLLKSRFAYTVDGGEEGGVEAECYNASHSRVHFLGHSHHPGSARGRLINAVTMASTFVGLLPRNESPEATDGRFGCLWANRISGGVEEAEVDVFCRDFDKAELDRRITSLDAYARAVEAAFPGSKVTVETSIQYRNMKDGLSSHPQVLEKLLKAVRATGIEPLIQSIRGGTDGARLTEKGLPTPNLFTGGMNYHSRTEWVALSAMRRAAQTLIALVSSEVTP